MLEENRYDEQHDSENNERRKGSGKKTALIVICSILAVILLLLGGILIYVNHLLGLMNRPEPIPSGESGLTLPPEETVPPDFTGPTVEVTWPTEPAKPVETDNVINIMLLGEDNRSGYYRGRTDSMILCTIHTKTKTVTLTSFMRDMYVQIPGWGDNRLNAAFVFGGIELFEETFMYNFGIRLDGVVIVEMIRFAEVIDLLGGVDIDMTQREVDHFRRAFGWDFHEGVNHITGEQALWYSRLREIDSDFERVKRQQKVVTSIINAYKQKPLTQLLPLLEQLLPMVTTNMSNGEIINYAIDMFPMLSGCQVVSQRLPADGTYQVGTINGMWVMVVDMEATREQLALLMKPQ